MTLIPAETLLALRESARRQTVARGLPEEAFDQADELVARGRVRLYDQRSGQVYDEGAWRDVSLAYCQHCQGGPICAHRLAIAFEALLARHNPAAHAGPAGTGNGAGGYSTVGYGAKVGGASRSGGGARRAKGCKRPCNTCGWYRQNRCQAGHKPRR
jgi:uncharacterized membrane protein YgcG